MRESQLITIQIAYELSKAANRCKTTRRAFTDIIFAKKYLIQNPSMISKVLSGTAVSQPVLSSILEFIDLSRPLVDQAREDYKLVLELQNLGERHDH